MTQESDGALCQRILATKDHYAVLGITKNASDTEINKAYKRVALRLHPDKNRHPQAESAFKRLQEANEVLSDPQKRRAYDNPAPTGYILREYSDDDEDMDDFFREACRGARGSWGQPREPEEPSPLPLILFLGVGLLAVYVVFHRAFVGFGSSSKRWGWQQAAWQSGRGSWNRPKFEEEGSLIGDTLGYFVSGLITVLRYMNKYSIY